MKHYLNKKILFKSNGNLYEGVVVNVDPSGKAFSVIVEGNNTHNWFETAATEVLSVLSQGLNESGTGGEQLING